MVRSLKGRIVMSRGDSFDKEMSFVKSLKDGGLVRDDEVTNGSQMADLLVHHGHYFKSNESIAG